MAERISGQDRTERALLSTPPAAEPTVSTDEAKSAKPAPKAPATEPRDGLDAASQKSRVAADVPDARPQAMVPPKGKSVLATSRDALASRGAPSSLQGDARTDLVAGKRTPDAAEATNLGVSPAYYARQFSLPDYKLLPLTQDYLKLFPNSGLDQTEAAAVIRQTQEQLGTILLYSNPADIQANIQAQFAGASELQKLVIAATIADLLGSYTYNYDAYETDTPTDTNTTEVLAALQQAMQTGRQAPAGICGDIHVAVAELLAPLGIDIGVASVPNHIITIFRSEDGKVGIIDYGTFYLGNNLREVLTQYEALNGTPNLWHYVGDEHGKIIGRVQTPMGAFLSGTVAPADAFDRFMRGEKIPEGTKVELLGAKRQVGQSEMVQRVGDDGYMKLGGGSVQVTGHDISYAVVGFGYEGKNVVFDAAVATHQAEMTTGFENRGLVGSVRAGWRGDPVKLAGGSLSYGAEVRGTGLTSATTDPLDGSVSAHNDGILEPRLGAQYDHPVGDGESSVFVSGNLQGYSAGKLQTTGDSAGVMRAGLRSFTFESHELELASGVRLNLSEQDQLALKTYYRTGGIEDALGFGGSYGRDKLNVGVGVEQRTATHWAGSDEVRVRAGVNAEVAPGTMLHAGVVSDGTLGTAGEVAIGHAGEIAWPNGGKLSKKEEARLREAGIDPTGVRLPREGLERGLQYVALVSLQRGDKLPAEVYSELGIAVDPVEQTVVLPSWVAGRLNVAGSARMSLENFNRLSLSPVLAVDAEFGTWAFEAMQTIERTRVAFKIGQEHRAVLGAEVNMAGGASGVLGYEHLAASGRKAGMSLGTNLQVTSWQGSTLFGDLNYYRSFGLGGIEVWSYRNPGDNLVDPMSGEVLAYKRARTLGGYLDLFQYVVKPEEQKKDIRAVVTRLGELSEQGVSTFFSPKVLRALDDPKKLHRFAEYLGGAKLTATVGALGRGEPKLDALVFDALDAADGNEYRARQGDLHIGNLGQDDWKVSDQEADAIDQLDRSWRSRGVRILGEEKLDAKERRGLERLLGFMERELDPAQYLNKQLVIRDGNFFRSVGEFFGFVGLQDNADAGASVMLSRRLLREASEVSLDPVRFELRAGATDKERKAADKLARLLGQEKLLINGAQRFSLVDSKTFERLAPPPENEVTSINDDRLFYRDKGTLYVDIQELAKTDPKRHLWELKNELGDRQLIGALQGILTQRTQRDRQLELARASGRGELHQYFPESPAERVENPTPGTRYSYRIFDAYGKPRFDRTYDLFFGDDGKSLTVTVRPEKGAPTTLSIANANDLSALSEKYPEIVTIVDGMANDEEKLAGLRVLNALRR